MRPWSDSKPRTVERLEYLNPQRSTHGFEARAQRTRRSDVVLPAPLYHDETSIDDVHVVVDAEGKLQGAGTSRVARGEPVAVKEARITGPDVIERRRVRVPKRVVHGREHDRSIIGGSHE